uniref:Helicase ATP-binding domain-containing protein n=1 Tax=Parastrongyloides trichosuri TaxID=131310 RepID=A0A0N4ZSL2_PARTI
MDEHKRLMLQENEYFPDETFKVEQNHYDDFQMHKDIIDCIAASGDSLVPSLLTYKFYKTLYEEPKRNVRIHGRHDKKTFMLYFPLILDNATRLHPDVPDKKYPLIIYIHSSPESAISTYNMIIGFTKNLKITTALSHQDRKMEENLKEMKKPFHILVTTIANLVHHCDKGILRYDQTSSVILVNMSHWKKNINYKFLTDEMLKMGWQPNNKCDVIAISEDFGIITKNIYKEFSFREHFDFDVFL